MSRIGKSIDAKYSSGWQGVDTRTDCSGYRISLGSEDSVLKIVVMFAQSCEYSKTTDLYTLKGWVLRYVNNI